jgi:hypothetical protein
MSAQPAPAEPLETIGLGGDGDEVDAIEAVEAHFGVALDTSKAPEWYTAGDVFASLLDALPPERRDADALWLPFAEIMCDEAGADPTRVVPETLLIGLPIRTYVGRWLKRLAARWR